MRKKTEDKTLYRNAVRKWKFLIQEYELVKQKRYPQLRFAADFYRFHQTHRQTASSSITASASVGATKLWSPRHAARSGNSAGARDLLSSRSCSTGGWA